MLAGFRSRWTMPFSCAASSASAIWRAIASASAIGNGRAPGDRPASALDQLEDQRGHAIGFFQAVDRADVRMVERGEQARFAREARRRSGSAVKCDGRILIATSRPSLLSRAR